MQTVPVSIAVRAREVSQSQGFVTGNDSWVRPVPRAEETITDGHGNHMRSFASDIHSDNSIMIISAYLAATIGVALVRMITC